MTWTQAAYWLLEVCKPAPTPQHGFVKLRNFKSPHELTQITGIVQNQVIWAHIHVLLVVRSNAKWLVTIYCTISILICIWSGVDCRLRDSVQSINYGRGLAYYFYQWTIDILWLHLLMMHRPTSHVKQPGYTFMGQATWLLCLGPISPQITR